MSSSGPFATPMERMQWWMRPTQAGLGQCEAAALVTEQVADRHAHVAVDDLGMPAAVDVAEHVRIETELRRRGSPWAPTIIDCCRWREALGFVFP